MLLHSLRPPITMVSASGSTEFQDGRARRPSLTRRIRWCETRMSQAEIPQVRARAAAQQRPT